MPNGSLSAYVTKKALSYAFGVTDTAALTEAGGPAAELQKPSKTYIGLLTSIPSKQRVASYTEMKAAGPTASTEAPGYTDAIELIGGSEALLSAATEGSSSTASILENAAKAITVYTASVTGGSKTAKIKGFYIWQEATSTKPVVLCWGELANEVTIGELYTPAKIEAGKLKIEVK
jgi:hypothetical protein